MKPFINFAIRREFYQWGLTNTIALGIYLKKNLPFHATLREILKVRIKKICCSE